MRTLLLPIAFLAVLSGGLLAVGWGLTVWPQADHRTHAILSMVELPAGLDGLAPVGDDPSDEPDDMADDEDAGSGPVTTTQAPGAPCAVSRSSRATSRNASVIGA